MSKLGNALTGKSKTVNLNAVAMIVVPLLQAFGVVIDPTIIAAGFTLLNFGLRFVTKKALDEK